MAGIILATFRDHPGESVGGAVQVEMMRVRPGVGVELNRFRLGIAGDAHPPVAKTWDATLRMLRAADASTNPEAVLG